MANIDINALSTDVRYVVPPVTSGYDCIPPLPKGELNLMGKLSLDAGLSVDDSGDYRCSSTDINGTVVLNLLVYSMLIYIIQKLNNHECCIENYYDNGWHTSIIK